MTKYVTSLNRNIGIPNRSGAVLLSSQTASGASNLDFVSGKDGIDFASYDALRFIWVSIGPVDDGTQLTFQASIDGGSNYNVAITSAPLVAYANEGDSATFAGYDSSPDQNEGTAFQQISRGIGNVDSGAPGESASGEMIVYGIRSAFAKQFRSVSNCYMNLNYTRMDNIHGYLQTASPLNAFQFKINSEAFDGTIKCYGILP